MTRILVVDDVRAMADQYAYDLQRLGGWPVRVATSGADALDALAEEAVDCLLLDLEMPGMDGFEVLRRIRSRGFDLPVIVYTGTGDFDRCARAVRLGAAGFIDKSDSMHRVVQEVRNALERGRLESEVGALRERLGGPGSLLGTSPAMSKLREEIQRLADIPSPVLIQGESGSGKELVARDLHDLGRAREEPWVAINCAALPEALVESELFGHERGAFTGADRQRRGAFERAGKGTLFLDEIGDLPPPAQATLLRAIESREVARVGGDETVAVQARVVAATHRELERAVEAGDFRQDLLYRLNVHVLRVPPLRDRVEDVPLLAEHFLAELCLRFGMPGRQLTADALDRLQTYDWRRNNVRELRNVVERMLIASDGPGLSAEDVPPDVSGNAKPPSTPDTGSFQDRKREAEKAIVQEALRRCDWHITRTASELGLADHSSLLKIMRRLGIQRPGA